MITKETQQKSIRSKHRYTNDFKIKAVCAVIEEGRKNKDVAQEVGVHINLISLWKKQYLNGQLPETPKRPDNNTLLLLQRQLEAVSKERDKYKRALNALLLEEDTAQ